MITDGYGWFSADCPARMRRDKSSAVVIAAQSWIIIAGFRQHALASFSDRLHVITLKCSRIMKSMTLRIAGIPTGELPRIATHGLYRVVMDAVAALSAPPARLLPSIADHPGHGALTDDRLAACFSPDRQGHGVEVYL